MNRWPTLQTERLLLRAFSLDDAPHVQRLAGNREVAELTSAIPHPYEEGMAAEWIATHEEGLMLQKFIPLAITLKVSGELVGTMTLLNFSQEHRHAELGYWIGREYWGRGFSTEAAQAMLDYGFHVLNLHRIHGRCLTRNHASARVMEKLGMQYEGCRREHENRAGKFEDIAVFGILQSEWRPPLLKQADDHA